MSILDFLHKPQTSLSHSLIKKWKLPRCPSVDNGMLYNIKLLHATIWMNLKDMMLSERSRTAKEDICI